MVEDTTLLDSIICCIKCSLLILITNNTAKDILKQYTNIQSVLVINYSLQVKQKAESITSTDAGQPEYTNTHTRPIKQHVSPKQANYIIHYLP